MDLAKSELKLIDFGMAQCVGVKRSRIAFDGCLRELIFRSFTIAWSVFTF